MISLDELQRQIEIDKNKKHDNQVYISMLNKLYADIEGYMNIICNKSDYKIEYNTIFIHEEATGRYTVEQMLITILDQVLKINPDGSDIIGGKGRVSLYTGYIDTTKVSQVNLLTDIQCLIILENTEYWSIKFKRNINNPNNKMTMELNLDTFCKLLLHLFYKQEFKQ